jgi:penicillin-binding protein 2
MKEEFDLEHSILEERAKQFEALELPLSYRVFQFFGVLAFILAAAAFAKIILLAAQKGDFYKARAEMNMAQSVTIPAMRGSIYDRFGNLLAGNETSHRAVLNAGLIRRENIDVNYIVEELGKILDIDKNELSEIIKKANFEKTALVTLSRNISPEQVKSIKNLGIKAIEIHDDYQRVYKEGPAFSHILGYTGLAQFNDLKGKAGLEKYYEDILGGTDGMRLMYRDAQGNILEEKLLDAPKHGADLYTTIDSGLQKYFYSRLLESLRYLGSNAAVGIVINPQNGEVLALASLPSYDNNIFTRSGNRNERQAILNGYSQPLFNRAISGVYAPGSTIKPLVTVAALNEGVIDPNKQIFSAGFIEIPNPYFPDQPSRFLDWKAHGWVDLYSALARSSNVYFYSIGGGFGDIKGLGIEKLKEYWGRFGFGAKTGIDLEPENIGFLPDPQEKEIRLKDMWRIGDTYNVSIGQGDFLVTPIQLISYIGGIANNGKVYRPHLLKNNEKEIIKDLSYLNDYIKEVQKGMEDAVAKWYGTAYMLVDLPISVAAKTGSAQIADNTKTNAFFVGYAPTENPQIAVLVLIENAREGSLNAVPVAKDVLDWYYWNRLVTGTIIP